MPITCTCHRGVWLKQNSNNGYCSLLLQRPLALGEPHALERAPLGEGAALEVEARVGELLKELGTRARTGSLAILLSDV
jgi:hypothetical protein